MSSCDARRVSDSELRLLAILSDSASGACKVYIQCTLVRSCKKEPRHSGAQPSFSAS